MSVERHCPSEILRLSSFRTTLIIKNNSRFNSGYIIITDNFLNSSTSLKPITFKPRQEILIDYDLTSRRRGVFHKGIVTLRTGGHFGIFHFNRNIQVTTEITVLPRFTDLISIPVSGFMDNYQKLAGRSNIFSRGSLLSGVKEYYPGEELRSVHWRSSAKRGEIILKDFEPESGQRAAIVIDNIFINGKYDVEERFDTMCEVAASVANYLINNGFSLRILTSEKSMSYVLNPTFKESLNYLAKIKAKYASKDLSFPRQLAGKYTAYTEETVIFITSDDKSAELPLNQNIFTIICKDSDLDKCIKSYTYA